MTTGDGGGHGDERAESASGISRLDGVRILVAEREPRVRELVADALGQYGARVTAVSSAVTALDLLKRDKPDALVSSLSLSDKDGYWLIREIRRLPPDQGGNVPAAAFTGLTTAEDRRKALQAGFQVHVAKPADLGKLAEVIAFLMVVGAQTVKAWEQREPSSWARGAEMAGGS